MNCSAACDTSFVGTTIAELFERNKYTFRESRREPLKSVQGKTCDPFSEAKPKSLSDSMTRADPFNLLIQRRSGAQMRYACVA
jgi:hypothetical protein